MRLLFVSGTTVGGSGRSQRELAGQLEHLGHEVLFLVDLERPDRAIRWWYEQLADLTAKLGARPAAGLIRQLERLPGRHTTGVTLDGLPHRCSPIPENAAVGLIAEFRPDVVVGSSVLRLTWRKVRSLCEAEGLPTVLYVREQASLNHFMLGSPPADVIVANAKSLRDAVEHLGYRCTFIPSVIDTATTRIESTRTAALFVNPIESHGVGLLLQIAQRLPHIPFVVRESWPLTNEQLTWVHTNLAVLPNVRFCRAVPPGPCLYADARVLLVPHRIDNRPRVIAEVQANGIPVIVSEMPGLLEAMGPGGVSAPIEDVDAWCEAIERLFSDADAYGTLSALALKHGTRPETSPIAVARSFESVVAAVVNRGLAPSPVEGGE